MKGTRERVPYRNSRESHERWKKKKEKEIYNYRVPLKGTAETIFLVLFLYMENVATIWYRALLLSLYIFETRRIIKRRTREFSNCCKKETLFLLPSRWKPWKISWDSLKSAALSSNPSFQQKLKFNNILTICNNF